MIPWFEAFAEAGGVRQDRIVLRRHGDAPTGNPERDAWMDHGTEYCLSRADATILRDSLTAALAVVHDDSLSLDDIRAAFAVLEHPRLDTTGPIPDGQDARDPALRRNAADPALPDTMPANIPPETDE